MTCVSIMASIGVAPIVFFAVSGGIFLAWYLLRSRSLLQRWAAANRYEILHSQVRELEKGPFGLTRSGKQAVYHVRVRSVDGTERSGWVCCGSAWFGVLSDKTEVKWDDEL